MHLLLITAAVAAIIQVGAAASGLTGLLSQSACGKTRGCWSFPKGCKSNDCQGLVQWQNDGKTLVVEMQSKDLSTFEHGRYVALGFSTDAGMGDDTVVECVYDADGSAAAYISHNGPSFNNQLLDASQKMIKKSSAVLKDGFMVCRLEIDYTQRENVIDSERKKIHVLDNKSWILQFARGLADSDTGEKIIHSLGDDDLYPWTTGEEVKLCKDCADKFQIVEKMQQF